LASSDFGPKRSRSGRRTAFVAPRPRYDDGVSASRCGPGSAPSPEGRRGVDVPVTGRVLWLSMPEPPTPLSLGLRCPEQLDPRRQEEHGHVAPHAPDPPAVALPHRPFRVWRTGDQPRPQEGAHRA
jgi:hypothetical protein